MRFYMSESPRDKMLKEVSLTEKQVRDFVKSYKIPKDLEEATIEELQHDVRTQLLGKYGRIMSLSNPDYLTANLAVASRGEFRSLENLFKSFRLNHVGEGSKKVCACKHHNLEYHFYVQHLISEQMAMVGSKCVTSVYNTEEGPCVFDDECIKDVNKAYYKMTKEKHARKKAEKEKEKLEKVEQEKKKLELEKAKAKRLEEQAERDRIFMEIQDRRYTQWVSNKCKGCYRQKFNDKCSCGLKARPVEIVETVDQYHLRENMYYYKCKCCKATELLTNEEIFSKGFYCLNCAGTKSRLNFRS